MQNRRFEHRVRFTSIVLYFKKFTCWQIFNGFQQTINLDLYSIP